MKNATTTSTTEIGSRLLGAIVWELSLLGHKTLDLVRMLLKPGGWFRSLPHVRILLVLSMVALICNDDISFSLRLGEPSTTAAEAHPAIPVASAGFFGTSAKLVSSMFSASAFAKTDLTLMNSQTGMALIKRFESTATAEQEKFGIDAGVLLASAIAAGAVETPAQVEQTSYTTNYFGSALKGEYPSAWSSWRAMSLGILASMETVDEPTRDDFVTAAALQFQDSEAARQRIYEALRFYQL